MSRARNTGMQTIGIGVTNPTPPELHEVSPSKKTSITAQSSGKLPHSSSSPSLLDALSNQPELVAMLKRVSSFHRSASTMDLAELAKYRDELESGSESASEKGESESVSEKGDIERQRVWINAIDSLVRARQVEAADDVVELLVMQLEKHTEYSFLRDMNALLGKVLKKESNGLDALTLNNALVEKAVTQYIGIAQSHQANPQAAWQHLLNIGALAKASSVNAATRDVILNLQEKAFKRYRQILVEGFIAGIQAEIEPILRRADALKKGLAYELTGERFTNFSEPTQLPPGLNSVIFHNTDFLQRLGDPQFYHAVLLQSMINRFSAWPYSTADWKPRDSADVASQWPEKTDDDYLAFMRVARYLLQNLNELRFPGQEDLLRGKLREALENFKVEFKPEEYFHYRLWEDLRKDEQRLSQAAKPARSVSVRLQRALLDVRSPLLTTDNDGALFMRGLLEHLDQRLRGATTLDEIDYWVERCREEHATCVYRDEFGRNKTIVRDVGFINIFAQIHRHRLTGHKDIVRAHSVREVIDAVYRATDAIENVYVGQRQHDLEKFHLYQDQAVDQVVEQARLRLEALEHATIKAEHINALSQKAWILLLHRVRHVENRIKRATSGGDIVKLLFVAANWLALTDSNRLNPLLTIVKHELISTMTKVATARMEQLSLSAQRKNMTVDVEKFEAFYVNFSERATSEMAVDRDNPKKAGKERARFVEDARKVPLQITPPVAAFLDRFGPKRSVSEADQVPVSIWREQLSQSAEVARNAQSSKQASSPTQLSTQAKKLLNRYWSALWEHYGSSWSQDEFLTDDPEESEAGASVVEARRAVRVYLNEEGQYIPGEDGKPIPMNAAEQCFRALCKPGSDFDQIFHSLWDDVSFNLDDLAEVNRVRGHMHGYLWRVHKVVAQRLENLPKALHDDFPNNFEGQDYAPMHKAVRSRLEALHKVSKKKESAARKRNVDRVKSLEKVTKRRLKAALREWKVAYSGGEYQRADELEKRIESCRQILDSNKDVYALWLTQSIRDADERIRPSFREYDSWHDKKEHEAKFRLLLKQVDRLAGQEVEALKPNINEIFRREGFLGSPVSEDLIEGLEGRVQGLVDDVIFEIELGLDLSHLYHLADSISKKGSARKDDTLDTRFFVAMRRELLAHLNGIVAQRREELVTGRLAQAKSAQEVVNTLEQAHGFSVEHVQKYVKAKAEKDKSARLVGFQVAEDVRDPQPIPRLVTADTSAVVRAASMEKVQDVARQRLSELGTSEAVLPEVARHRLESFDANRMRERLSGIEDIGRVVDESRSIGKQFIPVFSDIARMFGNIPQVAGNIFRGVTQRVESVHRKFHAVRSERLTQMGLNKEYHNVSSSAELIDRFNRDAVARAEFNDAFKLEVKRAVNHIDPHKGIQNQIDLLRELDDAIRHDKKFRGMRVPTGYQCSKARLYVEDEIKLLLRTVPISQRDQYSNIWDTLYVPEVRQKLARHNTGARPESEAQDRIGRPYSEGGPASTFGSTKGASPEKSRSSLEHSGAETTPVPPISTPTYGQSYG